MLLESGFNRLLLATGFAGLFDGYSKSVADRHRAEGRCFAKLLRCENEADLELRLGSIETVKLCVRELRSVLEQSRPDEKFGKIPTTLLKANTFYRRTVRQF